ncbi:hypothetical protein VTL71DRAFT_5872 [Oculimacula yallundae]|uniref:SH3 domain-containing protein n=1 Tax=Oculimacula yallundae TaxID=86028 RepID=A0ABR4BYR5_9HELO
MQKQVSGIMVKFYSLLCVLAAVPVGLAQTENCVSLAQSTTCSAFNQSSVSTDSFMVGLYPFLEGVTNSASFDRNLTAYLQEGYINLKYETLFGCSGVNTSNATNLYARFTTTVICNGVVQNSIARCGLTASNSRPVCADSCAQYALSEQRIVADSELCTSPSNYTNIQLRADYTNCGLPDDALVGSDCIEGRTNEPTNCGFGNATIGLCQYCRDTPNDSCCSSAQYSERCANVALPSISVNTTAFLTATATGSRSQTSSTPTGTATSSSDSPRRIEQADKGLSGGAIAGIVVGAVAGAVLLLALLVACCCYRKRKNQADKNKPRDGGKALVAAPMAYNIDNSQMSSLRSSRSEFEVLPGGRLARRTARPLSYSIPPSAPVGTSNAGQELPSSLQQLPPFSERSFDGGLSKFLAVPPKSVAGGPETDFIILPGGRKFRTSVTSQSIRSDSSPVSTLSDETETLPQKEHAAPTVAQKNHSILPPSSNAAPGSRRDESMSSGSEEYMTLPGGRLARKSGVTGSVGDHKTLESFRSPAESLKSGSTAKVDMARHPSKREAAVKSVTKGLTMPAALSVKDYYTSTDIRPGDNVTAVWSYAARTHDEFTLERGDVLHVTSIWGDGWAIGYLAPQGSDVSNEKETGEKKPTSLVDTSNKEVKAFPLVCVCASEYWDKVIEAGGKQLTTLSFDLI